MKSPFVLLAFILLSITMLTISFTAYAQIPDSDTAADTLPGIVAPLPTTDQYHGTFWPGLAPVEGAAFGIFPGVNPPWTMDCGAGSCLFTAVDGGLSLSQFEVFDFGGSIGTTSVPIPGSNCGFDDPDACLADPALSSGEFCLGPGTHSITMNQILNDDPGNGWIKALLRPGVLCAIGGMSIPIDSTALLLVGAQMNAAWIIPAIIIASGIGIFLVRRK